MSPAASTFAARAALQSLAAAGVREVVVAPGSRSAPLGYALADAVRADRPAGAPKLEVHVRVDERDAAFLALGLAKAAAATGDSRPVVVVTTSGTAVANLLPATLEAHHSGTPLILLTADRPGRLRGTGANQTTFQPGLLEPAVRLTLDLEDPATVREAVAFAARVALHPADPGPVHVNLALDEPLVPGDEPWPADPRPLGEDLGFFGTARSQAEALAAHGVELGEAADDVQDPEGVDADPPLAGGVPTVVVAGDGAGSVARELAEARGWPLLAEPTSGSRGGSSAVGAYRLLLDTWPTAQAVRRVVVVGRPTLSRPVARLLAREEVEVVRVQRPSAAWPRVGGSADLVVPEVPPSWFTAEAEPTGWLEEWLAAGRTVLARVREASATSLPGADGPGGLTSSDGALTGPALAELVAAASGPDDVLVVGSSNPVRDLDLVADWAEPPLVIGNRGLAGIDGMTATAAGVALALPDRTVRAVVGDLTFLHDVGGLLTGPLERRPRLQVIVANDDGGSVFATLEHGAPEHAAVFERFFATPQGADLAALCAGYGVPHRREQDPDAIRAALAEPGEGLTVLEVPVDRAGRRALDALVARGLA